MPERKQLPMLACRAAVQPKSFDADNRTVELTWSTGATVRRFDFWDGPYLEELSMDPAHVRMGRLNSGAPLLTSHDAYHLSGVIGVVERAWIDGGRGRAVVRFSERADVEPIIADVKAGILRNVSVGYQVHEYETEKPTERGGLPLYRATDWEPMEVSLVSIPADASAQIRSSTELYPVTITQRAVEMADQTDMQAPEEEAPANPMPETPSEAEITARAAKNERARVAGILESVRAAKLDAAFADRLIASGRPLDECRAEVIRAWSSNVDKNATPSRIEVGETSDEKFHVAAVAAIRARAGQERHDPQNEWTGRKLSEMARASLELRGVSCRGKLPIEIASMALTRQHRAYGQTTSDFDVILENTLHKTLMDAWMATPDTWSKICKIGSVGDLRAWNRINPGTISDIDAVNESGEYKFKTIPDGAKESIRAVRRGNRIAVTPETIIDDDLSYFSDVPTMFGGAARRSIESAFYALLTSNSGAGPVMNEDGLYLFHATHNNYVTTTGAGSPSIATVDAGRIAMASQTDVSGNEILDIKPAIFLGPLAHGSAARTLNNSQYDPDTTGKGNQRWNPAQGLFAQVIDTGRLTGTPWYMFADPAVMPTFEVVFLDGQTEPRLTQQEDFATAGLVWRVELPFGVGAIGWRGAYQNDGTA